MRRDAAALDNHLLKRAGGSCVISGAVPKKEKKQQDKTIKHYL